MRLLRRLYNLVIRQHGVPWRVRRWVALHWPRLYVLIRTGRPNVNTASYWDAKWGDPATADAAWCRSPNKFAAICARVAAGAHVLDVGCGLGFLMEMLRDRKGCRVTGVDISPGAVERVRAKGMDGIAAALPKLPCASGSFDFVIATELLEHLDRPRETLAEMARVAAPGGTLIVSSPDAALSPMEELEHLHVFDARSLEALLAEYAADVTVERVPEAGVGFDWLLACGTVRK